MGVTMCDGWCGVVPRRNQKGNSSAPPPQLARSRVGYGRCRGNVRFERHCGVMGDPSSHVCARSVGLWAGGTRVLYLQPATQDRLGLRLARWSTEVPVVWNFGRARGWASCWSPLTAFHANHHAKTGLCWDSPRPWGCPAWLARWHRSDESIKQVHRELSDIEIGRLAKLDHGKPAKYERGSEAARSRTAASHLLCKGNPRDGPPHKPEEFSESCRTEAPSKHD